jgi:hypothetical protein
MLSPVILKLVCHIDIRRYLPRRHIWEKCGDLLAKKHFSLLLATIKVNTERESWQLANRRRNKEIEFIGPFWQTFLL